MERLEVWLISLVAMTCCALCGLVICVDNLTPPQKISPRPYLSPEELAAYEALKRCPAWWDVRLNDASSKRELLRCLDELNQYETDGSGSV
jgi:hypothetical protein